MRISDWRSGVCSSDLPRTPDQAKLAVGGAAEGAVVRVARGCRQLQRLHHGEIGQQRHVELAVGFLQVIRTTGRLTRSEERCVGNADVRKVRSRVTAYH